LSEPAFEIVAAIGSTNSALLARLGQGATPGEHHWLIADRQSAGRGRAGRAWNDGAGNFMGSTVVHLRGGDPSPPTLALVAGVALARALVAVAGPVDGLALKWPNDVLVHGAKLAGVLLERQGDAVVVGIGVNLVQAPAVPDRPTQSLTGLGLTVARDAFAHALAGEWRTALDLWHAGGWPGLRDEWQALAHPRGTLLQTHDRDNGMVIGAFAGLDADGAALIRLADGQTHAIHAGDVDVVRD
jgi:BirA family biotin operon repressor/biotin-[acetyl-CoA-carboxylase] ligase